MSPTKPTKLKTILPVEILKNSIKTNMVIPAEITAANNEIIIKIKGVPNDTEILFKNNALKLVINAVTELALETDFLDFSTTKRVVKAPFAQIKYIKVLKGIYTTYMNVPPDIDSFNYFDWFMEHLPKEQFCRVHAKFMVNRNHIKEIKTGRTIKLIMSDGMALTVSETYKKDFINWYKS